MTRSCHMFRKICPYAIEYSMHSYSPKSKLKFHKFTKDAQLSEIDIQENVDDMPLLVIQDPISTRSHSKAK